MIKILNKKWCNNKWRAKLNLRMIINNNKIRTFKCRCSSRIHKKIIWIRSKTIMKRKMTNKISIIKANNNKFKDNKTLNKSNSSKLKRILFKENNKLNIKNHKQLLKSLKILGF